MFSCLFILDIILVICATYIIRITAWHILNPFLFFLIYHVFFVTFRGMNWLIFPESPLMYLPIIVNFSEIVLIKAFILEIIALFIYMLFYILVYAKMYRRKPIINEIDSINVGVLLTLIITGYFFLFFSNIFGFQIFNFDAENSIIGTLIIAIQNWFILLLIIIYFVRKKNNDYLILFFIISTIIIQAFQGFGRWRLMVDILLFIILYCVKNGIHFPKITLLKTIGLIFVFTIFSQLKYIGLLLFSIDAGLNLPTFSEFISSRNDVPFLFNFGDLFIIDHESALIKSFDNKDFMYGSSYLTNFEIFLPKYLFPNKHSVNYWLQDLPINSELFKINGGIPTLIGESYSNFGYFGPFFIITPISIISCYLFFSIQNSVLKNNITYSLIFYLGIFLSQFQILRDGFSSIFNFVFIVFFPLLIFKLLNIKIFKQKIETSK